MKVLRSGTEIAVYCFLNPPRQAAQIKQELGDAGHKGVLQDDTCTYMGEDLLQHGAYSFKVSEASTGKSISRPSCLVQVAWCLRLSPGLHGSHRPLLRSADAVVCLPSLVVCSGL